MTLQFLRAMVGLTFRNPGEAAHSIIALGLPRSVLWMGMALAVVLNTIIATLSVLSIPPENLLLSPGQHLGISGFFAVASMMAVHVIGRFFGGNGKFDAILAVFAWLQGVQVLLQAIVLVVVFFVPAVEGIAVMASVMIGLFLTVHFIKEAQELSSVLKAVGVLVVATFALAFVMSFLLALIWGDSLVDISNV